MKKLAMTVLSGMIAVACGPPIDDMQEQLSAAHNALPEVNEIYAALEDEITRKLNAQRTAGSHCPAIGVSDWPRPDGEDELWQAVHDKVQELRELAGKCLDARHAARRIGQFTELLLAQTEGRTGTRTYGRLRDYLTNVETGNVAAETDYTSQLAGGDRDAIWHGIWNRLHRWPDPLWEHARATTGGTLPEEFTTYPAKAREIVGQLRAEVDEALTQMEELKGRMTEEEEIGSTIEAQWRNERDLVAWKP